MKLIKTLQKLGPSKSFERHSDTTLHHHHKSDLRDSLEVSKHASYREENDVRMWKSALNLFLSSRSKCFSQQWNGNSQNWPVTQEVCLKASCLSRSRTGIAAIRKSLGNPEKSRAHPIFISKITIMITLLSNPHLRVEPAREVCLHFDLTYRHYELMLSRHFLVSIWFPRPLWLRDFQLEAIP